MSLISRYQNSFSILFLFGLTFIAFTNFRFSFMPLGMGELILLILGMVSIYKIYKENIIRELFSDPFIQFWLISFLLLIMGFLYNILYLHLPYKLNQVLHDFIAYGFSFLSIIMFFYLSKNIEFKNLLEKFIFLNLYLYIILLMTYFFSDYVIYGGARFTGFSNNPNQVALVLTIFIFLIIYLKENKYFTNYNYLGFICLTLVLVYMNKSNALYVGISSGFIVFGLLFLLNKTKYKKSLISVFIIICIFLICVVIYDYYNGHSIFSKGDVYVRLILYKNGLESLSNSFFFGLGPGPHSSWLSVKTGMWKLYESHNIYIDWLTQTGILGLIAFFYLLFKILKPLFSEKEYLLISGLVALLVFAFFHHIFRQPLFWFYLYSFYILGHKGKKQCAE